MKKFLNSKVLFILIAIIVSGGFLRLYNLNWDEGHYLHPDERLYVNASSITFPKTIDEFFSTESSLSPHMFYYGSFPLYLYKVIQTVFLPDISFLIASRLVSSLLSILTIFLIFLIGKEILSKTLGLIAAFIFASSVGSIQYAHFNTTESLLIFLLSAITLISILTVKKEAYSLFIILGILTGLSYATKIIGLTFIFLPLMSFLILFLKHRKTTKLAVWLIIFIVFTGIAGFLGAPYQIIDDTQFKVQQEYMQGVILGRNKPPFTIIYEGTLPYFYQFTQVLPFVFGFISFPLALAGFYLLTKKLSKTNYLYFFILLYPLLYFFWSGSWYVKFERYSLLLLPFLSIWAAFALQKFKKIPFLLSIILISINGLFFFRIYLNENTRIQASKWIYANIIEGSTISGEHWDDNLPLPIRDISFDKTFTQLQLPVYDPDTPEKTAKLTELLSRSDYFIISSRRVYYSILRNKEKYPETSIFYKQLFEGNLGFQLVKQFTNYPFYFSDDFADESFQSYDHPPVYVFENKDRFPKEKIYSLLVI